MEVVSFCQQRKVLVEKNLSFGPYRRQLLVDLVEHQAVAWVEQALKGDHLAMVHLMRVHVLSREPLSALQRKDGAMKFHASSRELIQIHRLRALLRLLLSLLASLQL